MRHLLRGLSVFLVGALMLPVAVMGTVVGAFLVLPLPATLPEARQGVESQISHVELADGTEIAQFRQFEQSIPVTRDDIPGVLKQAVVAAEDRRFYSHGGVDMTGTLRALWADLRGRRVVQGGSTITQQYVKNAYLERRRTIVRKLREAILATQLDREVPKDEVLFRYLSLIYFGGGAYGVGAASESYFGKRVNDLTLSEAAMLAGLIPAPTRYDPRLNPALAEQRRLVVLREMLQQRRITQAQYDEAVPQRIFALGRSAPPGVGPKGPATVVRAPEQLKTAYPYFVDYLQRYLLARYPHDLVYRGGLHIVVTLDPHAQEVAQKTVADALAGTSAPLDMALVSVEPPTGYVKALVGGRDFYAASGGQTNLALGNCPPTREPVHPEPPICISGGGSGRQPGSAFKPFTVAAAFEAGITPSRSYYAPHVYEYPPPCRASDPQCFVHNVEGDREGYLNLREATWYSVNTYFVQLVQAVGPSKVAELAHRLGITMIDPAKPHYPSITLGAEEVSPLDMAGAYAVFAARGLRATPTPVLKITDSKGAVIEDNSSPSPVRVLSEVVADNVTDVLRGVISQGTAYPRADIGRPAAGKTGTTDNNTNAWFVGYTPTLSTSVWMGYSDSSKKPLLNLKGFARVYGGTIPAQVWHDFMSTVLKDVPVTDFNQPAPIQPLAEDARRNARGGIDPGLRRYPAGTGSGGTFEYAPPPPDAQAPPITTTSTTSPALPPPPEGPATTTTTSRPPFLPGPAPGPAAAPRGASGPAP
ncbi:MAG: transglycosylase domain-containing protein [Acidimicrobiales bacterium]